MVPTRFGTWVGREGGRSSKAQWYICLPTFWIRHQRTYRYSLFTNIQWYNFWIILTTSLSSRRLLPSFPWGSDPHRYRNFYSLQADPPLDANTQSRITIRFPSMVVCSSAPPPSSRPLENHLRVVRTLVLSSSEWISNPACLLFSFCCMLGHYPNSLRYRGKCWPHTYYCTGRWPQGPDAATK
jgi:hypothetical protein